VIAPLHGSCGSLQKRWPREGGESATHDGEFKSLSQKFSRRTQRHPAGSGMGLPASNNEQRMRAAAGV